MNKDLEVRLSWITHVGLNSMTNILIKDKRGDMQKSSGRHWSDVVTAKAAKKCL